jgi:hypothetical protein
MFGTFQPPRATNRRGAKTFVRQLRRRVFYGGSIDNASGRDGKRYAALPNAFRYRNDLVAGCTCNGRAVIGLASIKPENDRPLRQGDIVASLNGFKVVRSLSYGSRQLPLPRMQTPATSPGHPSSPAVTLGSCEAAKRGLRASGAYPNAPGRQKPEEPNLSVAVMGFSN